LSDNDLDIAVLLACLHAENPGARHGLLDPKLRATFERLVGLFAAEYPINHGHREAPAMGRYANDRYFSGGPYFFSTLGAAQFCYRRAALDKDRHWFERGDLFLKMVRHYTPDDHSMSEQFDRITGAPRSARHLAWSYAAFLTCTEARRGTPYTT
jgi:glucoamylase